MAVLVSVGGHDGSVDLPSVEVYAPLLSEGHDASSSQWSLAEGEMGTVRSASGIAKVGSRVYYAGGSVGSAARSEVESFVLTKNKGPAGGGGCKRGGFRCDWRTEPSLLVPRMAMSLVATSDDILWAVGGYDNGDPLRTVEFSNAGDGGRWRSAPPLLAARCSSGALAVRGGAAAVILGGHGGREGPLDSCELLDPRAGAWQSLPPMRVRRSCLAAAPLPRDRILAIGGHDGTRALAAAEIFDLRAGKWEEDDAVTPLPTARSGLAAASFDDDCWKVLVLGGYPDGTVAGSDACALRVAEVWDDETRSWSREASMKCGRTGPGAASIEVT